MTRYEDLLGQRRIKESFLFEFPPKVTELDIQARWFSGEFGQKFLTHCGTSVEILDFGRWNREAGPDFKDVVLQFANEPPRKGCLEIDPHPEDWEQHKHAINPAYNEVLLHVSWEEAQQEYFLRTSDHKAIPRISIPVDFQISTQPENSTRPLAHPGRCSFVLSSLPAKEVQQIILSAAEFRLHRKTQKLDALMKTHGPDEGLYQALSATFGYKGNQLPFLILAQYFPLKTSQNLPPEELESLLFGVAGFLTPHTSKNGIKKSSAPYLQQLWNYWWQKYYEYERLILPCSTWKLYGIRPVNHPQRRLAALALLIQNWKALRRILKKGEIQPVMRFLKNLEHPFWSYHYTWHSAPTTRPLALIGPSRIQEIMANVLLPCFQALQIPIWEIYLKLPCSQPNRSAKTAAQRILHNHSLPKKFFHSLACQQGLLQIYEDFCIPDLTNCTHCPFPTQINGFCGSDCVEGKFFP